MFLFLGTLAYNLFCLFGLGFLVYFCLSVNEKGSGYLGVRDCSRQGGGGRGRNRRARFGWSGTLRGTRCILQKSGCVPLLLSCFWILKLGGTKWFSFSLFRFLLN